MTVPLAHRRFVGWFCPLCRWTTDFGKRFPRFDRAWCYRHPWAPSGVEMDCLFDDDRTGLYVPPGTATPPGTLT